MDKVGMLFTYIVMLVLDIVAISSIFRALEKSKFLLICAILGSIIFTIFLILLSIEIYKMLFK